MLGAFSVGKKIQKEITFASSIVVQASNLFNLPLTFSLDESSTDITQWSTSNFVYCHQVQLRQTIPTESSSCINNFTSFQDDHLADRNNARRVCCAGPICISRKAAGCIPERPAGHLHAAGALQWQPLSHQLGRNPAVQGAARWRQQH
jgi:hypothetical protein